MTLLILRKCKVCNFLNHSMSSSPCYDLFSLLRYVDRISVCLKPYDCFLLCRGETILSDYSYIPSVVFSSPHVAKVGLDEEDAVERYGDINIFSSTFR